MKRVNSMNSVPKKNTSLLQKSIFLVLLIFLAGCLMTGSVVAEKSTNDISLGICIVSASGPVLDKLFPINEVYVSNESTDDVHYLYMNITGTAEIASWPNLSTHFSEYFRGFKVTVEPWAYSLPNKQPLEGVRESFLSDGRLNYTLGLDKGDSTYPNYLLSSTKWNYSYTGDLLFWIGVEPNAANIILVGNGGSLDSSINKVVATTSSDSIAFFSNPIPTRDGYSFVGWSLTPDGNTIIATDFQKLDVSTEDIWRSPIACASYDDPSEKYEIIGKKWVIYENGVDIPLYAKWIPCPATNNRVSGSTILIINQNHVSEPDYVESHRVAFHANGGIGEMEVQKFTEDVPQKLMLNAFTREGYDFVGWAVNPDESVVYTDGQEITVTEDITLYAVWSEIPPRVPVWLIPLCVIFVLAACVVTCFAVWKRRK